VLQFVFGSVWSVFIVSRIFFLKVQNFGVKIPILHTFICKTKIFSTHNLFSCKFLAVCQNYVANLHCLSKSCRDQILDRTHGDEFGFGSVRFNEKQGSSLVRLLRVWFDSRLHLAVT